MLTVEEQPVRTRQSAGLGWSIRLIVPLLSLVLLSSYFFFFRLAERDLWSSHEGRAAQDAQTLLTSGFRDMPKLFDGRIDLQKPPLYYWLIAATAWLRGTPVDAWAVRFPAALAASLAAVTIFLLGWSRQRPLAGWVAAVVLITLIHYTWLARTGRIDMGLAFAVTAALGCFYQSLSTLPAWQRLLGQLVGYLALAAAVLLKGPIGLVLPAAVLAVHLAIERAIPSISSGRGWLALLHRLGLWWGLLLVAGLTLPWFLWADAQTAGEFSRVFFWYHNVQRGFGGSETLPSYPWWYYGPRLAIDLLPWSPVLLLAAWWYFRRGGWQQDREARLGLVWLLTMVVLLSLTRFKRADYLLPAYPGAALLLGCAAESWYRSTLQRLRWVGLFVLLVLGCGLGWWVYLAQVLPSQDVQREQRRFARLIRQHVPPPLPVIFFRVEEHALAFHLGPAIDTILEWENINTWAGRPGTYYIVMNPEEAGDWPLHITAGRLEVVARNSDLAGGCHERPLVLLRTCPAISPSKSGQQ